MKKKLFILFMAAVLAVSMTACGTKENDSGSGSADSASGQEASDDTKEISGATPALDAIKKAGKIVLLTEATFPPMEYVQGSGFAGIDIDIGQAIADRLGVELEIVDMNFDLLTDALNSGKGDFIAAGFAVTEERAAVVDFTEVYLMNGLMIVLPADSTYTSLEDLAGLTIAVQEGTTGHHLAEDRIDTAPDNIRAYKSVVEAGTAVRTGKVDAAVIDKLPAESIIKNSNGELKLMENIFEEEPIAIAVRKGNEDLLAFIQSVLDELEASGQLQEFIDYHMAAASLE